MKNNSSKGFTLIELVIVIVILGILSALALGKYVDIKNQGYLTSEKYIIGCVRTAIALEHSRAKAKDIDPTIPDDPFSLLAQPPSVVYNTGGTYDGISWHVDFQEHGTYLITCPHGKLQWQYFQTDPATGDHTGEISDCGEQATH